MERWIASKNWSPKVEAGASTQKKYSQLKNNSQPNKANKSRSLGTISHKFIQKTQKCTEVSEMYGCLRNVKKSQKFTKKLFCTSKQFKKYEKNCHCTVTQIILEMKQNRLRQRKSIDNMLLRKAVIMSTEESRQRRYHPYWQVGQFQSIRENDSQRKRKQQQQWELCTPYLSLAWSLWLGKTVQLKTLTNTGLSKVNDKSVVICRARRTWTPRFLKLGHSPCLFQTYYGILSWAYGKGRTSTALASDIM